MSEPSFEGTLAEYGLLPLRRERPGTVQLNLTARCNLACVHCHVESSPRRSEDMDRRTAERILALLDASPTVGCLDLTGGAPELSRQFRWLVAAARERRLDVIDRCNLTVFFEPGQEDTPEFLAGHQVRVVASLPCYERDRVEQQRGRNVFDPSIAALQHLNALGYGAPGSELELDLVYNPVDAVLPPPQAELEREYRIELRERYGIEFNRLYAIANMPIKRWADWLRRRGEYEAYLGLLHAHFNPETVKHVMCHELVSVAHDGALYDCDFNQQLELPLAGRRATVWDIESFSSLGGAEVATGAHCLGCTAGTGSSCGGALV